MGEPVLRLVRCNVQFMALPGHIANYQRSVRRYSTTAPALTPAHGFDISDAEPKAAMSPTIWLSLARLK